MKNTTGRMPLGGKKTTKSRKDVLKKMRTKAELTRDKSRLKLLEQRRRYKYKVEQNEKKMEAIKAGRERDLNPTAVQTMPSRGYAKLLRNPANLSTLPINPKYSHAESTRLRVYGKRFKIVDKDPSLLITELGEIKTKMKDATSSETGPLPKTESKKNPVKTGVKEKA